MAEIGVDMGRFPSAKHLGTSAGVCPGTRQSGGKRLRSTTTHGNPALRGILAEVVWVIAHTKDNYLAAQFHRLARRLGKKKAVVAVSHHLLTIIYHILRTNTPYADLGADYFDRLDTARIQQQHIRRLEQLGYTGTLTPREVV